MKVNVNNIIVQKTNEIWGRDEMVCMAMEEFAEAIQAVNKVKRFPNNKKYREKLTEEIADVFVIIDHLEALGLINQKEVQDVVDFKQKRQCSRNMEHENMKK